MTIWPQLYARKLSSGAEIALSSLLGHLLSLISAEVMAVDKKQNAAECLIEPQLAAAEILK